MKLAIVTATTDRERASACIDSWRAHSVTDFELLVVDNGPKAGVPYLGTVPAFRHGVDSLLELFSDLDVIACLHDDFEIREDRWDERVLRYFERYPQMGLAGFGGAIGLGADDLYRAPYDPMQLARIGFRSNLVDAEAHGTRSLLAERVACLDGFSQVGRTDFWLGARPAPQPLPHQCPNDHRPWTQLEELGVTHHFYDGMLGCLARRLGWETWYLPIRGKHHGGQTAVGDPGYQAWAQQQITGGDAGFWEQAHKIGYEAFRDVLPLRV